MDNITVDKITGVWKDAKNKIYNWHVAIVGDNDLAVETSLCMAASEFVNITAIDRYRSYKEISNKAIIGNANPDEYVLDVLEKYLKGVKKVGEQPPRFEKKFSSLTDYTSKLKEINDEKRINQIIDVSSSENSKLYSRDFSISYNIPYLSASVEGKRGVLYSSRSPQQDKKIFGEEFAENLLCPKYIGRNQHPSLNAMIAACITKEAANTCLSSSDIAQRVDQTSDEGEPESMQIWNNPIEKFEININDNGNQLKDKKILVVGGGGIGSHFIRLAAQQGAKEITLFDHDHVDERVIPKQIYHCRHIDETKVYSLTEEFSNFNTEIDGIAEKFDMHSDKKRNFEEYDLFVSGLDRNEPRLSLQYFASMYEKPLIDGGLDYMCADAVAYVPGKTGCLFDWGRLCIDGLKKERNSKENSKEKRPPWDRGTGTAATSCVDILHSGVVAIGLAVAGFYIELAEAALLKSSPKRFVFDSYSPARIFTQGTTSPCRHTRDDFLKIWGETNGD